MEVEAKFALSNVETFQRLQAADQLAGFALSAGQVQQMHDTYLDTAERRILAAGHACRKRELREGILVTLKGLKRGEGAIHRREELEVMLSADLPPEQWPESPLRDRVLELIGEAALEPLFSLQQTRLERSVRQDERRVAVMSLDDVHLVSGEREQAYLELEVELAAEGTEDDLKTIVTHLQDEWGLIPENRSKFERGLAFVGAAMEAAPAEDTLVTAAERTILEQIATRNDLYGRRARALLALNTGATQVVAGERAGMSERRVRHWLSAFRKRRLGIFPTRVLEQVGAEALAPPQPEIPSEQELEPSPPTPSPEPEKLQEPLPLDTLLDRYDVDRTRARTVADHALALFDHLQPAHGLSQERRSLLEAAALVHDVGRTSDPERPHIAGREILLTHPPAGLDPHEGHMVALTALLGRRRLSGKKLKKLRDDPVFAALDAPSQSETLAMAALVRIADGLDHSQTGSTHLAQVRPQEGEVTFEVEGPYAPVDAAHAQAQSDLWRLLFETELRFKARGTTPFESLLVAARENPALAKAMLPAQPGLEADDPMAEAGRKTLLFHFQRMIFHEPGTRLGEDIEELHDMRVATRRMRAALRVFGDYLDLEQMRPFIKGMRRTGRALGAVRDLDVFWEKTQRYLDSFPPEQQPDLSPLRAAWKAERQQARERMLAYLDDNRYARFKERFGEFLQTPGAGALPAAWVKEEPQPYRVRHVAPVAIYRRVAVLRAYDEWVVGPDVPLARLHLLRISAKRLRYTLEYLREVLSPEVETLIDEVKALQDHLGDLQDGVVASNLLRDFLTWGTWGHGETGTTETRRPAETIVAPGVAAYLTARQTELQHLIDTFPDMWARFQSPEFSRRVAAIVAGL